MGTHDYHIGQGSAKRRALGCVNSPPAARGSQEAGFTQPRTHLIADPCNDFCTSFVGMTEILSFVHFLLKRMKLI